MAYFVCLRKPAENILRDLDMDLDMPTPEFFTRTPLSRALSYSQAKTQRPVEEEEEPEVEEEQKLDDLLSQVEVS